MAAAVAGADAPEAAASAQRHLDRASFQETFEVVAIRVPAKKTGLFLKQLKDHLLNLPRRKNVESIPGEGANLILLARALTPAPRAELGTDAADAASEQEPPPALPEAARAWLLQQLGADCSLTRYTVTLGYEYFSAEEVLSRLLPSGTEVPSSFEQAGHVCHLNLRDSQLPYRYQIAQVILDKNKSLRTVVNKTGKIETEFRTFPMELLAGDPSTVVQLKEHGCIFEFDFRDVYWNSRLQMEHSRLVDALFLEPASDLAVDRPVLLDATCGVGPFSIPLARHGTRVMSHANDLNPESVRWLRRNAELNKLANVVEVQELPAFEEAGQLAVPREGTRLAIHAPGDARALVRGLHAKRHPVTHSIFNLPAAGVELLDCYSGLDFCAAGLPRPLVCCYTFSDAKVDSPGSDGCVADLLTRLARALGLPSSALAATADLPLPSPQVEEMVRAAALPAQGPRVAVAVRLVRNVAPTRHMFCVCFRAPAAADAEVPEKARNPADKRARHE